MLQIQLVVRGRLELGASGFQVSASNHSTTLPYRSARKLKHKCTHKRKRNEKKKEREEEKCYMYFYAMKEV